MARKEQWLYFHPQEKKETLGAKLLENIYNMKQQNQPLVFLCIGTDRVTGDCLGPLVGHRLIQHEFSKKEWDVFGTLKNPVHAGNLDDVTYRLNQMSPKPFVVAVDACLGEKDHIGLVTLSKKGIFPGQGVNKHLPLIGDLSITGIVNSSGRGGLHKIQNTRLSLVMDLADYISEEIGWVVKKIFI
jgi:putative sporulation protein YyaC